MSENTNVPVSIAEDIALYMTPGEKILDAIASTSGPVGKIGELWMILSDKTMYFHTREFGKEPVVALIPRSEIRVVTYEQHKTGVTLTFVPSGFPRNSIQVPFPKKQKTQVNEFCEKLSKSIPFELVPPPSKSETVPPADTATPRRFPPMSGEPADSPAVSNFTKVDHPGTGSGTGSGSGSATGFTKPSEPSKAPPSVKIAKSTAPRQVPPAFGFPGPAAAPPANSGAQAQSANLEAPDFAFVFLATAISVLVAFLWYHLFKSILNKA
jgi:hypothetical protein